MKQVFARFSAWRRTSRRKTPVSSAVSSGDRATWIELAKTEIILALVVGELISIRRSLLKMLKDCETCSDCKHGDILKASTASLESTFARLNRMLAASSS